MISMTGNAEQRSDLETIGNDDLNISLRFIKQKKPDGRRRPVFQLLRENLNQFEIEHQYFIRTYRRVATCAKGQFRRNKYLPG